MYPGNLYIVATPIGNLQDITMRALDTLKDCDLVVCEDTRVTGKLLHHFSITKPMRALNEFNEMMVAPEIIDMIQKGTNVALVSDSGTPLISDPGYRLVSAAKHQNVTVIPIPGPSAVIAALSASGLPTHAFLFLGFLPKTRNKKRKMFEYVTELSKGSISPTILSYESPHRIMETLQLIEEICGNITLVIARELTKVHEEITTATVQEFYAIYNKQPARGELTLAFNLHS